jgi:AhpD family alkylhydroperoxidase
MKMSHARSEYEDFKSLAPEAYDAVFALTRAAAKAGLDKQLLELIKLRASQINGCAFCVQFHILQAESLGVPVDKLNSWWSGARRRSFPRVSAPHWHGPKR